MNDKDLREFRAHAITTKMCKQMDEYIDKAEGPGEIVDILVGWSQVLGAVIATIPGSNNDDFHKIMHRCWENAEAAFLAELMYRKPKPKGPKK